MTGDKIKIIEFGMGDDDTSAGGSTGGTRDKGMKIIEFDNARDDERKPVATAVDVGSIKIVEFDDDAGPEKAKPKPAPAAERPRSPVGPIKIKEFDKEEEAEARSRGSGSPKMKIMEFD